MVNQKQIRVWLRLSLFYLIAAALLGLLLRSAFVFDLPAFINYKYIQQTHSHIAMIGWLYNGLFIFIIYLFRLFKSFYSKLFWLNQIAILGMLFSFPFQGYGGFSIFFSTLYLFLSYVFIYNVYKDFKKKSIATNSSKLILLSLFFLFISSIGTWSLAYLMSSGTPKSSLYYGAIQFFLHFQFNGWFVFAILGILFKLIENQNIEINQKLFHRFLILLTVSCVLTLALAISWSTPLAFIFYINSIGVLIQLSALYFLFKILYSVKDDLKKNVTRFTYNLLLIALIALSFKIVIQSFVAFPNIAVISYTIRNFVIGFIHLLMLGCISLFLFGMINHIQVFDDSKARKGLYIFMGGIVLSEFMLFLQGLLIWMKMGFIENYYMLLFAVSILLPLGAIIYSISIRTKSPHL